MVLYNPMHCFSKKVEDIGHRMQPKCQNETEIKLPFPGQPHVKASLRSSLAIKEPGPDMMRSSTAHSNMSYEMKSSESAMPSLAEDPCGQER